MRHSTDRILVSHAGNLPRPDELNELIDGGRNTEPSGSPEYHARLPRAVAYIVEKQVEHGVDVVNDGEYVKAGSYGGYIYPRLAGFEMLPVDPNRPSRSVGTGGRDRVNFPGVYQTHLWFSGSGGPIRPGFLVDGVRTGPAGAGGQAGRQRVAVGPIKYTGQEAIREDIANLKAAIAGKDVEGYIAAIGPLSVGGNARNDHYASDDDVLFATAEALGEEWKAIADAGLIVQIDEPQLATTWEFHPDWTLEETRSYLERAIEAINHGLRGVPRENVRLHFCWGSGHRPHSTDLELKHFADIMAKAQAQMISFEAANVRHQHEWSVWKDVKLEPGTILMPGVISHATDLVEHPENVAERIEKFASVVGRENVQTGTDCGIGSRVGHEEIAWAKLRAMSEGARIASRRLWQG
jgi:5-methyltetrahydropteroyltriglutamate--homocysteine methyltransferase